MSKTDPNQRILRMMESEERKNQTQVEQLKKFYIEEITKMKKEELFPKPKKLTLWKKIKILILGN